jgi:acetolactate synthase-1/3 small subunit
VSPEPFLGQTDSAPVRHHILSVLVENKAGVLARIAGLFARRGFNIYSLAVAPAEGNARFSRVTIVVDAQSAPLEQIVAQLNKLVNVVEITDLATLPVDSATRAGVLEVAANTGASIVDVNAASMTVMLAGTPAACDRLEKALEAFSDVALQRTGRVALPRLGQTANA